MKIKYNIKNRYNQFLILFFLLGNVLVFGQSGQANGNIPNQIPPSPESFKFTQYGEIPVNESSGNANVDIPLYTYKAGRINIPISLSHNGGAVKVDEPNTWTGVSWLLNVGGVINRTVNDLVDETTQTGNRLLYNSPGSFVPNQSSELAMLASGGVDSEVDVFNYNFPGHSGSFYFDENMTPRLMKYDKEIRIELSEDPIVNGITVFEKRTITITTSDGTKYFFGGVEASESTKSRHSQSDITPYAQTSFYLFKIQNYYGDEVNFTYTQGGPSSELSGYNQTYTKELSIEGISTCSPQIGFHVNPPKPYYILTMGKLKLQKIESNRNLNKVIFNTQNLSVNYNKFVLNQIVIKDKNDETFKKIDLEYLKPGGDFLNRFFLSDVKIFEDNQISTNNIYRFEYVSPELLPARFSYSQDYMGYYNAKNNTTLVPKVNDPALLTQYQVQYGDRYVSLIHTLYGSLKKVYYPTKGFTEFEYEGSVNPNEYKTDVNNRQNFIYINDPLRNPISRPMHSTSSASLNDNGLIPLINVNAPIVVNIVAQVNGSLTQHHRLKFTLRETNSNTIQTHEIWLENASNDPKYYNEIKSFTNLVPNGIYEFKLEYYALNGTPGPTFLEASADIKFETISDEPVYFPGTRIKRVLSYPDVSSQPLITRYYYNKAAKRNLGESRVIVSKPNFVSNTIRTGSCNDSCSRGTCCYPYTIYERNIHTNTQNNLYVSVSNGSMYQFVTVSYGGDNFENGGKEMHFFIQSDIPASALVYDEDGNSYQKVSNTSLKNGTLMKEIIFKAGSTFNILSGEITNGKVKEITNSYTIDESKNYRATNCFVYKKYEASLCSVGIINPDLYVGNYFFSYYYTFTWWHLLEKTTTKEYLENGFIQTEVNYSYESGLAGLPSSVETIDGNGTNKTSYKYPTDDLSNSANLFLKDRFRISDPIETNKFYNGQLLSKQQNVYSVFNGLALPSAIKESKGENIMENKIYFSGYDSNFNLTNIRQPNGLAVIYVWGYDKNFPIAKIEYGVPSVEGNDLPPLPINNDLIIAAQNASNTGTHNQLLQQLEALRASAAPDVMINTYTYDPLLGIKTSTDVKGDITTYVYGEDNQLKLVRDSNNKILSEYEYKYKPQN